MKPILNHTSAMLLVLVISSWSHPLCDQRQTANTPEQQAKYTDAEEAWRTASKAHPSDPVPLANLGLLEARKGHYTQAIDLYGRRWRCSLPCPVCA